jgi:hypothetical protein
MLATLKRLALFAVVGAFIADGVALAFAPRLLSWYQTPSAGDALCNCADLTLATAHALVVVQLAASATGALLFVVAGEGLWRAWRRKRSAAAIALVSPSSSSSSSSSSS